MRNFKNLSKKEKAEYLAMLFLYPLFLLFRQLGNVCKFFEQKKRQLIASVLSFAVIVASVPVLSLTTFAASGHTHCLCGTTHTAIGDHKTEARTTFTAWNESTKLPYEGGTYYLTTDVTLSSPWFPEIGKSYIICLNGHSIQGSNFDSKWYSDNGVIYARENINLTICDCVGGGSVSSDSSCDVSGLLVDAGYKTKPVVNIFGGSYLNNKRDGIKVGDGFVNIYKATIKKNTHYGISSLTRDSNVLNIYNAEITQNGGTSIDGGGIYHRLGTCNFYNGKVTNNNTNYRGGGVYNGGTFNFFGGEISGNTTNTPGDDSNEYGGGGIYNYGTLNVSGGKISNNRTNKSGGGICNYGNDGKAEVNISGGEITGNYSRLGGGGVYLSYNGKGFNMSGGTISNNTASGSGGGVFASKTNPLVMTGGKIIKNGTGYNGGGVVVSSFLKISGDAEINSNYYSGDNSKSNIFLVGKSTDTGIVDIRVAGKLTGGEFGVDVNDVQNLNRALAYGSGYTMTQEDAAKFVSEYSGYETIFKNSKVYLRKIPENLTAEDFTFTPPADLTYDGNAKPATVTSTKVTEQDKITVKYYDKDGEKLSGAPTLPGTYTVSIDVAETEGYNAIAGLKSDEWKFQITPQQLNESDITVSGLESQYLYTGSAVKPSFEVQVKGETVAADGDRYSVFYGKNIKGEGSVNVVLNSKYGYIGSRTFTFNIDYGTADDTMYIMPAANENGWYKGDIEIPAAEGYKISRTDNNFSNRVIISNESDNGSVVVYLKSISTGEIYKGTINYKIDKTVPTDIKVSYNQSVFKKILNTISFGLFYRENVSVEAKAEYSLSGVDKVLYYAADSKLTLSEQNSVDWVESLTLTPNCKKIIYVKVIDKAGNRIIANDQGIVLYGDSTVKAPNNQFDLNTEKSDYVKVKILFNGNTLKQIKNGNTVLVKDTDYIDDSDIMYIAPKYLKQFNEGDEVTLTFTFNPMGVESSVVTETDVKIKIIDTTDYHRTATKTEYKAPNCLETGNEAYWQCDVCGKYFADNNGVLDASKAYDNIDKFVIGALGHDFTEEIADNDHLISAATCLDKAVYCYDCSRCDEKDESKTYEYGNSLGHDFTEEKVDNDHLISVATCLDKAVYCYDCSRCDEKDESKTYEYGNPLGHNFTEKIIDDDHLVKAATCLEPAVYCFDCSRCDEKDASKTYTNGNSLGHKYTNYIYNGDATYFANGTETADCDHSGCTVKDTRECQNSKLIDSTAPKAEITLGENSWNTILNNITFGLFFKDTQSVNIDYTDNESGVKDKYYFVSNEEITDFSNVDWKVYDGSFNIDPNGKYVVYARVVDKVGNFAIYNSNGLVLDSIAPKLSVNDGDVYCGEVTITVTEDNFDYLTVDGNRVDLTDGQFKLTDKETAQKIEVFDKAGNKTELSVKVNREHTFDESKITTPATVTTEGVRTYYCKYCDATHTQPVEKLPPKIVNGAGSGYKLGSGKSLTFRSNASLADFVSVSVDGKVIDPENYTLSEGGTVVKFNADFLGTLSEGKHTVSINSTSGSATTEFTVAKDKIANGKKVGVSPKTGVRADYILWLSLAVLLSADVLTSVVLLKKKARSK